MIIIITSEKFEIFSFVTYIHTYVPQNYFEKIKYLETLESSSFKNMYIPTTKGWETFVFDFISTADKSNDNLISRY